CERRRRLPHQGWHRLRRAHAGGAGAHVRGTDLVIRRVALAPIAAALAATTLAPQAASARVEGRVETVHKTVTIHIRDNLFTPPSLNVAEGTTVRWINDGRNTHNVTPVTGKEYGSPDLKPGRSYVHTFAVAETYKYYCTLHGTPTSGQRGELAVGDAAAATPAPIV